MTTGQMIGAAFGFAIIAVVLWKVLRIPRHGNGNHDAWHSGGEADGTGPGD